jgi:hypothetical protein
MKILATCPHCSGNEVKRANDGEGEPGFICLGCDAFLYFENFEFYADDGSSGERP